jgi:hypothetical protein
VVGRDADVEGRLLMVGLGKGSMFAAAAEGGGGCARTYGLCDDWGGGAVTDEETTAAKGGRDRASLDDRPGLDPSPGLFEDVLFAEARKDWPAGNCPKK